jgi:N-acetylglucosamine-6-phosphate deacetylase
MIRAKTPRRTVLITDAIAAAGCGPGSYRLGSVDVEVGVDRRVSLRGTPYLAGSALTLPEAIGNTVRFTELSLEEVLPMASTIPAEYLGIQTSGTVVAEWEDANFSVRAVRDGNATT